MFGGAPLNASENIKTFFDKMFYKFVSPFMKNSYSIISRLFTNKSSDIVKLCDAYCKVFLNQRYTGFVLTVNPKSRFLEMQTIIKAKKIQEQFFQKNCPE